MIWSVECRALTTELSNNELITTTVHLPGELTTSWHTHLASWLGVHHSTVLSLDDVLEFRSIWSNQPLKTDEDLVRSAIPMLLYGPPVPFLTDGFICTPLPFSSSRDNEEFEYTLHRMYQSTKATARWNDAKTRAAGVISNLLNRFPPRDRGREDDLEFKKLLAHQIPFSHSPEIGSVTLQQLLTGGIRSACLLPLATGVGLGTNNLAAGQTLIAFEAVLAGGGMTICAMSTLWIADKLLKGVKNLRGVDFKAITDEERKPTPRGKGSKKAKTRRAPPASDAGPD